LLVISFLSLVRTAGADGGVVLFRRTAGQFNLTIFLTDVPVRPGPADLSILLESTEEHIPILDAQVFVELEYEGTIIRSEATRSKARNKLLYCSLINLPEAGSWKMKVLVRHGSDGAEIPGELLVVAPRPVLLSYWTLIAAPPLIIIVFVLNQLVRRGRSNRKREVGSQG
jgi:hypothetical protein